LAQALRSGTLEIVDLGLEPDVTPISIAYLAPPAAKLTALIEHLKRAFGVPPHWDVGVGLPQLSAADAS